MGFKFRLLSKKILLGSFVGLTLIAVTWVGIRYYPQELDCCFSTHKDKMYRFLVGKHSIEIRFTDWKTNGEGSYVNLRIISNGAEVAVLPSVYDYDFFAVGAPARVHWFWIDDDWQQDLVIETNRIGLKKYYISSRDGRVKKFPKF
jgi:hypothetical protein